MTALRIAHLFISTFVLVLVGNSGRPNSAPAAFAVPTAQAQVSEAPPRPAEFRGNPNVTITAFDTSGGIVCSRDGDTLVTPAFIQCSASAITATGTDDPYGDLEYSWDFGHPTGSELFTNPVTQKTVNANNAQTGPEAAYVWRAAGTYRVTLTVRGKSGNSYPSTTVTKEFNVRNWNGTTYYFDSKNGNDTNPGTSERAPKKTITGPGGLNSLIASNRQFLFKRGEEWHEGGGGISIITSRPLSNIRFDAYGSGDPPKIKVSENAKTALSLWNTGPRSDIVLSNIQFWAVGNAWANGQSILHLLWNNDRNALANVYFDNCSTHMAITSDAINLSSVFQASVGSVLTDPITAPVNKTGMWKCSINTEPGSKGKQSVVYWNAYNWSFLVGINPWNTVSGVPDGQGGARPTHYGYVGAYRHGLYRWNNMNGTGPHSGGFNGDWDTQPFSKEVTSWNYSGGTATATAPNHQIDSNNVAIQGAASSGPGNLNGTFVLTAKDRDTFSFALASDFGVVTKPGHWIVRYSKFSEAKYWHYAENRITGALFAFDASNGNNDSQNVHIGPIVNEGNAVFNMTGPAYFSGNSTQYTIRDNLYWNNATLIYAPQVHATNFAGAFNGKILGVAGILQSKVYRNKVYRPSGAGGNGAYLYSYFNGSKLFPIQSIAWEPSNGGRAVVTTGAPHNLVIGSVFKLYLTGQNPAGYSGTKDVEVTGTNQFKFRSANLGSVSSPGSWFFAYAHPQQFTDNVIVDLRTSPNIGQHIYAQLMQAGSIIKRNQYWAPYSSSFLYDVNAARTLPQIQALPGAPEEGSFVADPKWPDPANGNFGQMNFLLRRDIGPGAANDHAPLFVNAAA